MVILDTNIIIDQLRQPPRKSHLYKLSRQMPKDTFAISVISVQELYEGKSTKDEIKEEKMLATISPLKILPYTFEIAQMAGEIMRDLEKPIELADAAIAATAILNEAQLFTLNKKDLDSVQNLQLFNQTD